MCNNMMIQFMMAMNQLQQMPFMMTNQSGLSLPFPNSIMPTYGAGLPYYDFSNTSSEGAGGANTTGNNSLASTQNMMNQLGFTKANGYSVAQNADGSLLFTYNKDGKTCIASTLRELMDNVNSNATDNSSKLEDSLAVHKDDTDEVAEEDSETPDETTPDAADETDSDTPATPARQARAHKADLSGKKIGGKELEWKGYNKIDSNTKVGKYIKDNVKNGTTLKRLVYVMLPRATEKEREMYKQWLIDGNPNGIVDGKVADVNKLDLPVYKTASAASTTSKVTSASSKVAKVDEEKITYYNNSKNSISKARGGWTNDSDTDAIFHINNYDYKLHGNGDYWDAFDYWDITNQRTSYQNDSSILIDKKTGKFLPNNEILTKNKGFKLEGAGPLNGAQIVLEKGNVVLKDKNGKILGLMDDVMLGNVKV